MNKMAIILILMLVAGWLTGVADAHAKGKTKSSSGYKSYSGGKVIDGDTFRYNGERYRIQQYNAPEIGQPGSRKATRKLQRKLDSGNYEWKPITKDVYGRTIVREKER